MIFGIAELPRAAIGTAKARLSKEKGDPGQLLAETMAHATEIAQQFPRLRQRLDAAAGTDLYTTDEDTFQPGPHAMLDGFTVQLPTG